jgi:hypothetical protein
MQFLKPNPPPEFNVQAGDVYLEIYPIAETAVKYGFDPHAVADGLLEAARKILADNQEFMTAFEKFCAQWNIKVVFPEE